MIHQLNNIQQDALREVLNIAACNASTSLSVLLQKKVNVGAPLLHIDAIQNMPRFIKNPQEIMTVILVETSLDMEGHLIIVCDPKSTVELLNLLTGKKVEHVEVLDEYEKSALREVGNILTGSAITALNNFLHFNIIQSVSDVATDMVGALFNNLMAQIGLRADYALEFNMNFSVEGTAIKGSLIGILSPESTMKTLEAINNKYHHLI